MHALGVEIAWTEIIKQEQIQPYDKFGKQFTSGVRLGNFRPQLSHSGNYIISDIFMNGERVRWPDGSEMECNARDHDK